ncbi:MAG: NAD-dependent epimerase/dehydratase family protein [Chitinophagales bacterium]
MPTSNKIVITGANGFIGSHLAEYMAAKGFEVHCIVRSTSNLQWLENKGFHFHKIGLENVADLTKAFEASKYIFHLAGTVAALKYETYIHGNVTLTKNVLDAAAALEIKPEKILVTSSLAVSGPTSKEKPLKESDGFNPKVSYGKAKVEQEKLCAEYFDKLNITIARPSPITGTREVEMFEFIQSINKGIYPKVGFSEKYVNIIHISDLLDSFYKMIITEKTTSEAYFLCSENIYSWSEIAKVCGQLLGKKPFTLALPHFIILIAGFFSGLYGKIIGKAQTFDYEKAKEGIEEAWLGSMEKAKADFGFEQKVSLAEGLKVAIDWYKLKKWLK